MVSALFLSESILNYLVSKNFQQGKSHSFLRQRRCLKSRMCWSLHCFFKHLSKERLYPLVIPSEKKWLSRSLRILVQLPQDYLVLQNKYFLNWTRENLPLFAENKGAARPFLRCYLNLFLLLFKSIARRCVLDVLLFHFCCFLIILTFYHYKEHSRIPWTEMTVGAHISFECIYIMWFFNTFIRSFLLTVEREKQKEAVQSDSSTRRTEG